MTGATQIIPDGASVLIEGMNGLVEIQSRQWIVDFAPDVNLQVLPMEKEIKTRFSDAILGEAKQRFGIHDDQIKLLDGFESFMYEFSRRDGDFILRIGHSLRRSADLIRGEVDWINYLAAGGAGVAKAIRSHGGELVEAIDDGLDGSFLATAFVRAPGGPSWEKGFWQDDTLLQRYGHLIGKIHALSKQYKPAHPAWKRPHWDDPAMLDVVRWFPSSQPIVLDRYRELMAHLGSLPRDEDSYGLIHQDAHAGNFFLDEEGNITLFDFDDCAYGWYVYDLAMVLFYAVTNRDDINQFGPRFWRHFMSGYLQECDLDQDWLAEIPHFMKLREIDLYAIIHRSFDLNRLEDDPWVANFMRERRAKIENDEPYIDFDCKTVLDRI